METTQGRVTSIAINEHRMSFALDRKNNERYVLYDEAPNTQAIPQFEVATRSWMLALLQTAFTSKKELVVKFDPDANRLVSRLELWDPLVINEDLLGKGPAVPVGGGVGGQPIQKGK
ncbi:hypothetical protein F183_A31920 [Bryobacterales bacterium F-183]|nr:hypothetical protein F183_A31920 [Bryobacterales bacterium F-183]